MGRKKSRKLLVHHEVPILDITTKKEIDSIIYQLITLCHQEMPPVLKMSAYFKELYELINYLILKQKEFALIRKLPTSTKERKEYLDALFHELKADGINLGKCAPVCFDLEGFGLAACQDLLSHEEILRIPVEKMMTSTTANASLGKFIKSDPLISKMPNIALAIHLLSELSIGAHSSWKTYIYGLPADFETVLYHTPQDVEFLKGTQVLESVVTIFRNICRQYAYLYRTLSENHEAHLIAFKDCLCFEDYRWAVSAVMSRNNQLPESSGSVQLALVPVWDLINHRNGQTTTDFIDECKSLVFYSMENCNTGDQILMHYGNRTNAEYFIYSGFIPEINSVDTISFKLGISSQDPLSFLRQQLLQKFDLKSAEIFLLSRSNALPENLITFAEIFCMKKEMLEEILSTETCLKKFIDLKDTNLKQDVLSFLAIRFKLLIQASSLRESTSTINMTHRSLLCLEMGKSEQSLLSHNLDFLLKTY